MNSKVWSLVGGREGHFKMESGLHSAYWMDLETLCLSPTLLMPLAMELSERLRDCRADTVCGALNEGAFVGLMVARELNLKFTYSERMVRQQKDANALFPIEYRLPKPLRSVVNGKRVVIVNDVISAGSAVRGTLTDLRACGAYVVAIGSLLELGSEFRAFVRQQGIPYASLEAQEFQMWEPSECPLCKEGQAIEELS